MIYLAHIRCASNHNIVGGMAELDQDQQDAFREQMMQQFDGMIAAKVIPPRCLICNSAEFHTDLIATVCKTMEEAKPMVEDEVARGIKERLLHNSRN